MAPLSDSIRPPKAHPEPSVGQMEASKAKRRYQKDPVHVKLMEALARRGIYHSLMGHRGRKRRPKT